MAIGLGSQIDVTLKYFWGSSTQMSVFSYAVAELTSIPTAVNYGEAWWNHMKTTTRALVGSAVGDVFSSVVVRELNNPSGELAEFDIPSGERAGTRSTPTQNQYLPSFTSVGIRLTVNTRATRPGQKRWSTLYEEDNTNGQVTAAYKALIVAWANVFTAPITLGAPAAATVLTPIVCRRDAQGTVLASQAITGYVVNSWLTTQNTRKLGRGI